jgi:hypothetical protein
MRVQEFMPEPIRLKAAPILRFHGYRNLERVAPAIVEVAQAMVAIAEKLVDPRAVFVRRPIERVGGETLELEDGPTFHGRCFAKHLSSSRETVCFLVTMGSALDDRVTELADAGDLLEAVFLEAAGWLAIEGTLRAFRAHLGARLREERLRLSPRLAPGFLDWSLTEQLAFFSAFDDAPLPVSVNEYCVMSPKKSISGLFGLLPSD